MASSLSLKKLVSSNLIPTSVRAIRPTATASRFFNTNAARRLDDNDDIEVDHRAAPTLSSRPVGFFPGMMDPLWPSRSLSEVLNLMDQVVESPFRGMGSGFRRGWDARETDDALNLRVEMPGLDKEDVKVSVEHNTLIIKGEGVKESEDEESSRRYTSRIDLPEKVYRTDEIKAEMKNGVLKVTVPKVKEEERNDVFHVKVE